MSWEAGWDESAWKDAEWKAEGADTQDWKDQQWQADAQWQETDAKTAEDTWNASADSVAWDGAAAAEAAPADPWAANGGGDAAGGAANAAWEGWGASGGEAAKTPGTSKDYWDTQSWNVQAGILSRKDEAECERDDVALFTERLGSSAGLAFEKYESVPVDLSGNKSNMIPVCKTFEELYTTFNECIPPALMDNVRRCCYKTPTPVQKYAIPVGLAGRDIMCCAQTGSGKTAAFLMPVIGRMMLQHENPVGNLETPFEGPCSPDTVVITPTRELCLQIYEEALKFCHRTRYRVVRLYGGEKPKIQMEEACKGCDVMIATPGRLQDFIDRGITTVQKTHILVLDEADRMLDMGFAPQIRSIVENHDMPSKEERQTMMFSATFAEECQKMAQDFLYDYIWIGVGVVGGAVETVEQRLEKVTPAKKYDRLVQTLDEWYTQRRTEERCLVFCNAKDTAKFLDEALYQKNIDTGALHGNLEQWEREKNLARFRKGEIDVMIATDVAARGLDIESVTLVINYDMPQDIDSYIHRIGRTGRIGNEGKAITFISMDEQYGTCLEKGDTLSKLLQVMKDSKCTIPDWLEGTIDEASGGYGSKWKWGGQDVRPDQETFAGNGAGDEWSNWRGHSSDNSQQQWGDSWK